MPLFRVLFIYLYSGRWFQGDTAVGYIMSTCEPQRRDIYMGETIKLIIIETWPSR